MRIVLFDLLFMPGHPGTTGLSDHIWNWARHLVEAGDEVHIVAAYPEDTQVPTGARLHCFPLPPMGQRNLLGRTLTVLRGWRIIQELGRIDLIQVPETHSAAIFGLMSHDVPVIERVPGNIFEEILSSGRPGDFLSTQLLKLFTVIAAKKSRCLIVTSKSMQESWVKSGAHPDKTVLIPTGIDTDLFCPYPNARKTLNVPAEQQMVLFVGRFARTKGLLCLIEAIASLHETIPHLVLHMVGDGELRTYIEQQVVDRDLQQHLVFHGWLDKTKLAWYYSAADVTVLPSFSEGFPRTMLEALACGSPFLGTAVSGIVDCITDGETGMLVPPGDTLALTNRLHRLLTDKELACCLGDAGRSLVEQRYSWSAVIARMKTDVYSRFL